jgi:hypothetical protein
MVGFGVGSTIGNMIAPGHLPNMYGPRLSDLTVSTSANGAFIPFGYGTNAFGGNIIWSPGLVEHSTTVTQSGGGKGGPTVTTTSYTYTVSFAVGFGEGPGTVLKVWGDAKILYDASGGAYVNFTGDFSDTTVYTVGQVIKFDNKYWVLQVPWSQLPTPNPEEPPFGTLIWAPYNGTIITTSTPKYPPPVIYEGDDTQLPNPTIQANVGAADTPAYRGLIYAVWSDLPLADFGNRLPNIRAVIRFGTFVQPIGLQASSLTAYGYNSTASGAFNLNWSGTVGHPVFVGSGSTVPGFPQYTFAPNSLHWQGATGQNTQIATLNSAGVVIANTDSGHYENWEACIVGKMVVNVAGTYTFNLSHDDGAMWGFAATADSGGGTCTFVSGTIVNPQGATKTAYQGYTLMAGNNHSGSWTTDPLSVTFSLPGVYGFEINWTNWEHRSRLILTVNNGQELVFTGTGTNTDTTGIDFMTTDICERCGIDGSLVDATDLVFVPPNVTPAPGALTNALSEVVTGGGLFFNWSGWDIDQQTGNIWSIQYHLIGGASALCKATLSHGALSFTHINTATSALGMTYPDGILVDPVDGTVLVHGNVGGTGTSRKYNYDADTVIATSTTVGVPSMGTIHDGVKLGNEQFLIGNQIHSAADFSLISTINYAGYGTDTQYGQIWDGATHILASRGGAVGVGHKSTKLDTLNQTGTGITTLIDAGSSGNITTQGGNNIGLSPDGNYCVSNHGDFVDFYDKATMTLIAHITVGCADFAIDDHNIAYLRLSSDGKTIVRYDVTTGASLGTLGAFTLSSNLDGGLGMLFHPTEGTWLMMHGNGNLEGMFIRGVPQACAADPIASCQGYLVSRPADGRTLLSQLSQAFFFDGVESDGKLKFIRRGAHPAVLTIPEEDLGIAGDKARVLQTIMQEQDVSQIVTVMHMDSSIDYQQGKQEKRRSSRVAKTKNQTIIELPMVLAQSVARQIAEKTLNQQWLERMPWAFNLWRPYYMILDPTDVVDFVFEGVTYEQRIVTSTIGQDYKVSMNGVSHDTCTYASLAPGGTAGAGGSGGTGVIIPTSSGVASTDMFLFDIPYLRDTDASLDRLQTGFYWVLTSSDASWPGAVLDQSQDGGTTFTALGSTAQRTFFGTANTTLPDPPCNGLWAWDTTSTLNITMQNGTLSGVTDADVYNGLNALLVGNELIQFVNAVQELDGSYTISRLLRGRRNTEPFAYGHQSGESVVQPDTGINRSVFADSFINSTDLYKGLTIGTDPSSGGTTSFQDTGNDLKPAAPVHITGKWDANNNMFISWMRRTRYGGKGLVGPTPLNEDAEAYNLDVYNGVNVVRKIDWTGSYDNNGNPVVLYSAAQQTADGFTPGVSSIHVKVYQLSAELKS